MSKVQSWWIYQDKKALDPWTIHLFCTKDGRKIVCDFDLFAEWIPNRSKRITAENIHSSNRLVETVRDICVSFNIDFTADDEKTIRDEVKTMLEQFN